MSVEERVLKKAIADIEQLQGAYELMSTLAELRKEEIESLKSRAEKAEREKGCEYCRGWDKRCGASFCPMCGRELEEYHEAD